MDSYLPFVLHCLEELEKPEVSTIDLQARLQTQFDQELPHAVLKRILHRAHTEERLRYEQGVYTVKPEAVAGCSLASDIADVERSRAQLVDALADFSATEFNVEWDEETARSQLGAYINGFSSQVLAAAIGGEHLASGAAKSNANQYIMQRFAARVSRRYLDLFDILLSLVKGRMLADALFFVSDEKGSPPTLSNVEIYLDGPPLLYVLGYAGPELQAPYSELLAMLDRQEAIVRCFEHSVTEAREIMDAAAARANAGGSTSGYHGDVVAHLVRSGKSSLDIEMLSNRLETDLLKLSINPVQTPPRKPHLQPDEEDLAERLQKVLKYGNRLARDRDIDSLTAVHRLRDGKEFRDLEKAKAVFVTHNFNLFRISTQFFRQKDRRTIPPCLFDMSLATMLWLREPAAQPNLPQDRIEATAYAALNPDDQLWAKYNAAIDKLQASGDVNEDDAIFLRYDRDAQEALMDETRGDHEAFTEGTIAQVMERARENLLADTRAERDTAVDAVDTASHELGLTHARVRSIAVGGGQAVASGVVGIVGVALLLGAFFGPVGPVEGSVVPGVVQAICTLLFVTLAVGSLFYRSTLLEVHGKMAAWLAKKIQGTLEKLFRLPRANGTADGD